MAGPGRPRGVKTRTELDIVLTPLEQRRAQIQSRLYASLACRDLALIGLRERLFGGRVLTLDEAQALLLQVGPRFFDIDWFEKHGIPLLAHQSLYYDPHLGPKPLDMTLSTMIRFTWRGGSLDVPRAAFIGADGHGHNPRLVLPRGELRVAPHSVLGQIQSVASDLSQHYLWSESAATLFVMTGNPPPVFAIGVRHPGGWRGDHTRFVFDLRVEPWVTADSVKRAIQHLQRDAYGHEVRSMRGRALVLVEFIEAFREQRIGKSWAEMEEQGLDFPWTEAAELWDEKHGQQLWRYTPSNMSRDFERAWMAIVHPPVKPLGIPRKRKSKE